MARVGGLFYSYTAEWKGRKMCLGHAISRKIFRGNSADALKKEGEGRPPHPQLFLKGWMVASAAEREHFLFPLKGEKRKKKERDKTAVFSSFLLGLSFLSLFPPPPLRSTPGG